MNKFVLINSFNPRMVLIMLWVLSPLLGFSLPANGQGTSAQEQEVATLYSYQNQLDINNADFDDIARLPISRELAERIFDRVQYQGPFSSIYQLREVEGLTQEILLRLKPLVRIEPYEEKSEREERIEQFYFRLDRWGGDEGTNQALVDFWIEQALEPVDINQIRYDQLINLQGVSPVDAAAIIGYRNQVGRISSLRDLRSAPYISYFGYRNARDFVTFEEPERRREFHGNVLFRMSNTPFLTEEADVADQSVVDLGATAISSGEAENDYPDVYTRFLGNWGSNLKVGVSYWHALNEPLLKDDLGFARVPNGKFYLGLENQRLGPLQLRKLYIGNYSLAFGQGVVMENTDFFQPRKSGFDFRKRFIGISGDNSRTREFKLSGAAAELAYGNAHLFLFGSFDRRDAIINTTPILFKGELVHPFNQLIILDQRFKFAPGDEARENLDLPWRGQVKELLYGFHAAYDIFPATQVGVTYYESAYDRPLRPDIEEVVDPQNLGQITLPDNEIFSAYGGPVSDGENPFWGGAKSFRRVYGLDFQSVYQNLSVQAEYAELDRRESVSLFGLTGHNPWAFTGSAYLQYNSFELLGLYRHYQLGFDNPYQRSFSNYQRFKRTIFEDYFYLQSPFYGQLFTNSAQPQAEEGFYFNTRYQMNRKLTLMLEYDNWRRVADDISQFRLRGTLQYRPVFPITVSLRQKYQGRDALNNLNTEYFENLEFRGSLRFRLSRFNDLSLLYMNAITKFRPRPRLYYPVETGIDLQSSNFAGNIGAPGEALGASYTHNFNEWLKVRGFLGYYKGFFWNFEDTQFFVVNSDRGAMRYWLSIYSRISSRVSLRLKYTRDRQFPVTFLQARDTDNQPIEPGNPSFQPGKYYRTDLVQPIQEFYYMEFNVHF